jgi:hypothetical protein
MDEPLTGLLVFPVESDQLFAEMTFSARNGAQLGASPVTANVTARPILSPRLFDRCIHF